MAKIAQLRQDCDEAAKFYEDKSGLAASAGTIVELYRTIARLAGIIENFSK